MNRFINNVMYMGFSKIILWLFLNFIFYILVDTFLYLLEDMLNMKHKIYIYDLANMFVWFVFFVVGIYRYYIPKKR